MCIASHCPNPFLKSTGILITIFIIDVAAAVVVVYHHFHHHFMVVVVHR
jgi:hypothetical protein